MILCLDLGTKTGWAYRNKNSLLSGTKNFGSKNIESPARRFVRFETWLEEFFQHFPTEIVYFEGVRAHKGTSAAHIYGGFVAILISSCEKRKIEFQSIPVGTIKKHITGYGNAKKHMVIEAVSKRAGFLPTDDNEADALALLDFVGG